MIENIQESRIQIGQWQATIEEVQHALSKASSATIRVKANNRSPVSDTGDDTGGDNETGYRLTSEEIEQDYQNKGDPHIQPVEKSFDNPLFKVVFYLDEDNHLNVYIQLSNKEDYEIIENEHGGLMFFTIRSKNADKNIIFKPTFILSNFYKDKSIEQNEFVDNEEYPLSNLPEILNKAIEYGLDVQLIQAKNEDSKTVLYFSKNGFRQR